MILFATTRGNALRQIPTIIRTVLFLPVTRLVVNLPEGIGERCGSIGTWLVAYGKGTLKEYDQQRNLKTPIKTRTLHLSEP
jgi:hypothetical protein